MTSRKLDPKRRASVSYTLTDTGNELLFAYRRRRNALAGFLSIWMAVWTAGCVFLTVMVAKQPDLERILFVIPFWAAWFAGASMLANTFFSRDELSLGPNGVTFCRRVIVPLNRRHVPLEEVKAFVAYYDRTWGVRGVETQTAGKPLRFAAELQAEERHELILKLNQHLARLRPKYAEKINEALLKSDVEPSDDDTSNEDEEHEEPGDDCAEDKALEAESAETFVNSAATNLTTDDPPAARPSDSDWHRIEDFHAIIFSSRGQFSLMAVLVLLFLNAFWNGIVCIFLFMALGLISGGPDGLERWIMLLFLIPFVLIGSLFLVLLITAILEPVRTSRWRLDESQISYRFTYLGLGPSWRYPATHIDGLQIQWDVESGRKGLKRFARKKSTDAGDFVPHRLAFVDRNSEPVCTIDDLTEGEARWMGGIVRRERAGWFHGRD
jgi:hypothetical protein